MKSAFLPFLFSPSLQDVSLRRSKSIGKVWNFIEHISLWSVLLRLV